MKRNSDVLSSYPYCQYSNLSDQHIVPFSAGSEIALEGSELEIHAGFEHLAEFRSQSLG